MCIFLATRLIILILKILEIIVISTPIAMTMNGFSVVPWNLSRAITISDIHHNCDSITSLFGNDCLILRIWIFGGCLFVKPMKVRVCSDKKKTRVQLHM